MSIVRVADTLLKSSLESKIRHAEFMRRVFLLHGNTSKESVRGTIGGNRLQRIPEFAKGWVLVREKTSTFICKKPVGNRLEYKLDYEDENKHALRIKLLSLIPDGGNALTMPAEKGLCASLFLTKAKQVVCLEKNKEVLDRYKALGLPTEDHHTDVQNYLKLNTQNFDMFYYDTVGYVCGYHLTNLQLINSRKQFKAVAFSVIDIDRFRATQAQYLTDKYGTTTNCIEQVMSNYEVREIIKYRRNNANRTRGMRTYLLTLKGE